MMEGSSITIGPHDSISLTKLYKHRVPSAAEVKLIIDYLPDFSAEKVALGFMLSQGLRPTEVIRMRWHWLKFNPDKDRVIEHTHWIYKPRSTKIALGNHWKFKETKKPVYSKWLSDQIIGYAKRAPKYESDKMFPWSTTDGIDKYWRKLRKLVIAKKKGCEQFEFMFDRCTEPVYGTPNCQYRVGIYSFRRFAITFHYWVTYKQDLVKTAKIFGHCKPDTTFEHYISPKEAIGLDDKMIEEKIDIDQFIHLMGKNQMQLIAFDPAWKKRFVPVGQRQLMDFE